MSGSFAAEIIKLGRRWTTWVLLGVWLVLNLLFRYALPYTSYLTGDGNQETQGLDPQQVLNGVLPEALVGNSISGFPVFAGAVALILGALSVGSEYGWGTLKTALTQGPGRMAVHAGKVLALALTMLAFVLVTFAVGAAVSAAIAAAESSPMTWPSALDLVEGIAAGWLVVTTWCLLGALLGFTFRSVALPVGLGVVWVIGIENLISSVAGSLLTSLRPLRDVLPGTNAGSLVAALAPDVGASTPGVLDAVSGGRGAITLAAYAIAAAALAALALHRRDVT